MRKKENATKTGKQPAKDIPRFHSEDQERAFWANHDITEYFNADDEIPSDLSRVKPSTRTVTIRFPEHLLRALKILANKKDIPYQSLLKVFLAERIQEELSRFEDPTLS